MQGKHILFLNWKDILNPSAGGAEIITDALASHMAKTNTVIYFTSAYPSSKKTEQYHGYTIIRKGNIASVIIHAWIYWQINEGYKKFQLIIDQAHGVPFFSIFYYNHPKIITIVHEIADELWKQIVSFVFLGKIIDRIWLFIYRKQQIITISKSTALELENQGIPRKNISILPLFHSIPSATIARKPSVPTLLVLGRLAPVKQIEHAISAFQLAKKDIPSLCLIIAGKSQSMHTTYEQTVRSLISGDSNIALHTNVSEQEKIILLTTSHLLIIPSKKEGFGITILEASACSTPTIGYDVAGIRDAIQHGYNGILTASPTPKALATSIVLALQNKARYYTMQAHAHKYATKFTKAHTLSAYDHLLEKTI